MSPTRMLVATVVAVSCHGQVVVAPPSDEVPEAVDVDSGPAEETGGLDAVLTDGTATSAEKPVTLAPATVLPDRDADALLAHVPPIADEPADTATVALRPSPTPLPRTGRVIADGFAGSHGVTPAPVSVGPLHVVRITPAGGASKVPSLTVTFDQPMVPIGAQDDVATAVPVVLSPQAPGTWRWLGTQTVMFQPTGRFPQATRFRVEVPAGTRSASGGVLREAARSSFDTRPPVVEASYPRGAPFRTDEPMFVRFDQRIEADAVLAHITVRAGGRTVPVERVDASVSPKLSKLAVAAHRDGHDGRWLAFRARGLSANQTVEVTIGAGTPSAEGPLTTRDDQHYSWSTYPPFEVIATCAACSTDESLAVRFTTPLDPHAFSASQVEVAPRLDGQMIHADRDVIVITGVTRPRAHYRVHLAASIADVFGQHLGHAVDHEVVVDDPPPALVGPGDITVLDPGATRPVTSVWSSHYDRLRVRTYAVTPADYPAYLASRDATSKALPGRLASDTTMTVGAASSWLVESIIDVSPALVAGKGHAIVIIEPSPLPAKPSDPQRLVTWVQSTALAIDAHLDADHVLAYASELATGTPASGVRVEVRPFGVVGETDPTGVASLAVVSPRRSGPQVITATRGRDVAIAAISGSSVHETWTERDHVSQLTWYVVDDRRIYRPGEEVHLKGLLRVTDRRRGGDLAGLAGAVTRVHYAVIDELGVQLATGDLPVSAAGSFDTAFRLPATANLGGAVVKLTAVGRITGAHDHDFDIGEFRRPAYEITAEASPGPAVVGGAADFTVHARYYTGAPLKYALASWHLRAQPAHYTPPGRDDFVFGAGTAKPRSWNLEGTTDATGSHTAHLALRGIDPAVPVTVSAEVHVQDVDRQTQLVSASTLVHPAACYVGVRSHARIAEPGTPVDVEVIGVDLDGKATPGVAIDVTAAREADDKLVDIEHCSVVAALTARACTFHPAQAGHYVISATIADAAGHLARTTDDVWVGDGGAMPKTSVDQQQVQLIADRTTYGAGDTAKILVRTPFVPAEGLVTWRRSGIVHTQHLVMTAAATTIEVPIDDAMVPNLYVQVDLAGSEPRLDGRGKPDARLAKQPAYASGRVDLAIPPRRRTLDVSVTPAPAILAPGEHTSIGVRVRDADGHPVADAETTVIVVDEAVLALADSPIRHPIDVMYPHRDSDTSDVEFRSNVVLVPPAYAETRGNVPIIDPGSTRVRPYSRDRDADGLLDKSDRGFDIHVRSNLNPLAAFAPVVRTDRDGRATVAVTLPDNLTRYRIIAIAHAGERQFGKGDSVITTRLPVMVRPSAPRFLSLGDRFELPVVVHNQTAAAMTVTLAARATNASFTDGRARELVVPAHDRAEIRLPATTVRAGTARFQLVVASGSLRDAAELAIPVYTPATTESFASYGTIDHGAIAQTIAMPKHAIGQLGGVDVTTSSTNLASLTDALVYLVRYPYECAEQRASRIVAITSLADVLAAFHDSQLPSPAALRASVTADIAQLEQMQNADGGFAYWERGAASELFLSAYVTSVLAIAKAKGVVVGAETLKRAAGYLRTIEKAYPATLGRDARLAISAYAIHVRSQLGELDLVKGQRLLRDAGGPAKLPLEADGWLLATFAGNPAVATERRALVSHLGDRIAETSGSASMVTDYGDANYLLLASEHRVDAVVLDALIAEQRDHDAIPKLVTGLLAHRTAGRWRSTQESAFVLMSLARYFRTYESATPDFIARVWLGADYAGDHAFKGRTTDSHRIHVAMPDVQRIATPDGSPLTIEKDGPGRLYYRIGMTYVPASLMLEPADRGFVVARRYEGMDDPSAVRHDTSGWHVKAGARVRVVVTMVNTSRRTHVALVDPLPAGFEAIGSKDLGGRGAYWYEPWFDHQNLRDDRVEAFSQLLWEGPHELVYEVRATTPGSFTAPPPRAEEMYQPENFGRGGSERVIVESG